MNRSSHWALGALLALLAIPVAVDASEPAAPPGVHQAAPIPAFARLYKTACSTCHVAAPKLNGLGEAFRLSAYSLPEHPLLQVQEDSVSLGAEPWKDLWPQGIWPSKLPGSFPLALRIQTDLAFTDDGEERRTDFDFPHEFYLLAAASFDPGLAVFFESEWSDAGGFEVKQARVMVQDVIPGLPEKSLNLWLGKQDLFLFTFANRQIDRAARQQFTWQSFSPSKVVLRGPAGSGQEYEASSEFELGDTYAALEVNGLLTPRLYYGAGISQGVGEGARDLNQRKDGYYKLRYKFGGMALDGTAAEDDFSSFGGQMRETALILEHFGYFGGEANPDGDDDSHRSFGFAARGLRGRWDVGVGWVQTRTDGAWSGAAGAEVTARSLFGKAEWSAYPWLFLSLKGDWFRLTDLEGAAAGVALPADDEILRVIPGFFALVRQNVRLVGELDLRANQPPSPPNPTASRPWGVYLRLDIAF